MTGPAFHTDAEIGQQIARALDAYARGTPAPRAERPHRVLTVAEIFAEVMGTT